MDWHEPPGRGLWRGELLAAVAQDGDLAERHFLEVKSQLDLQVVEQRAKIAKFILGASNRMPDVARSKLGGYAVMVVGVGSDGIKGIDPVELLQLRQWLDPYLGSDGPAWDAEWIDARDGGGKVLLVYVEPPEWGQPPFPCWKQLDGARGKLPVLVKGEVYVRRDGETTKAGPQDVVNLAGRSAQRPVSAPKLGVAIEGALYGVSARPDGRASTVDLLLEALQVDLADREWGRDVLMGAYEESTQALASQFADPIRFKITAGERHLSQLLVTFTFPPGVVGLEPVDKDADLAAALPEGPWTPRPQPYWAAVAPYVPRVTSNTYPLRWQMESEGLVVRVVLAELHATDEWLSDDDDLRLWVSDDSATSIEVSWKAVSKDSPQPLTGTLTLPIRRLGGAVPKGSE